jgi:hypothetical protein
VDVNDSVTAAFALAAGSWTLTDVPFALVAETVVDPVVLVTTVADAPVPADCAAGGDTVDEPEHAASAKMTIAVPSAPIAPTFSCRTPSSNANAQGPMSVSCFFTVFGRTTRFLQQEATVSFCLRRNHVKSCASYMQARRFPVGLVNSAE